MARITRLAGLAGITLLLVPLVTASAELDGKRREDDQSIALPGRAAVAGSPDRRRHGLRGGDEQHHGSARASRRKDAEGRAQPGDELDGQRRRKDLHDPSPPHWALDERPAGHRPGLRVLVEARARPEARSWLRLHHVRDQGRACLQHVQAQLRAPPRPGRGKGARQVDDPRHARAVPALVPVPARPQRVLRRAPSRCRALGQQVDRAVAHRHQRAVPARQMAARRGGRPAEMERLA